MKSAAADKSAVSKASAVGLKGPSPNSMTNLVVADIALRGGGTIVRRGIERGLLGKTYDAKKAKSILKGRGMTEALVSAAIAKLATKSVPGAILVGGGLLAKTLYDRRKGAQAIREGEAAINTMAVKGSGKDEDSQ